MLPKCLDSRAVAVAEGGIPETTALLAQQWDRIFFTSSPCRKTLLRHWRGPAKRTYPLDLDRGDVIAAPDRLQHGVREPQEEDVPDRESA